MPLPVVLTAVARSILLASRDRTDVGDLSNTEDNVYPSSGMMGEHPLGRSSLHHQNEMMPPAGYAGRARDELR